MTNLAPTATAEASGARGPGVLNLMTAGRGIAHSEETPPRNERTKQFQPSSTIHVDGGDDIVG